MKRLRIKFEPRDCWLGVYVAPDAVYVCVLPFLPIIWRRGALLRLGSEGSGR